MSNKEKAEILEEQGDANEDLIEKRKRSKKKNLSIMNSKVITLIILIYLYFPLFSLFIFFMIKLQKNFNMRRIINPMEIIN